MNHNKLIIYSIFWCLIVFSCGSKSPDIEATPDEPTEKILDRQAVPNISSVNRNINDIVDDLHMEIKKLKAELDYQHENMSIFLGQTIQNS